VGYNDGGLVSQCVSTDQVSGSLSTGGLVGVNSGWITNCYCLGSVQGSQYVGGLVANNGGHVTSCYSTGRVRGAGAGASVGGLVGCNGGPVAQCLWDTQTSGLIQSAGGSGKTTLQMQDIQTYLAAGWDFVGEIQNGTHEVWQMPPGGGYPVLAMLNGFTPVQLQGMGTAEDPYLISNALDLGAMIHCSPSACYRLAASIDLAGTHWGTAVVPRFGGTFDGNHLAIRNLVITGDTYLGLFGQLGPGAEVQDLDLIDANIVGTGDFVGSLAGLSEGNLTHCTSACTVSGRVWIGGLVGRGRGTLIACRVAGAAFGTDRVGGLMGENDQGQVIRSASSGQVDGRNCVGGLVGISHGEVTQCYSTAAAMGTGGDVAGLVGWNAGNVTECYSVGPVTGGPWNHGGLVVANSTRSVSRCFWDIQTSGQASSDGGTGKTTALMQTASTFATAGWDFVEIWTICEGRDYPRLRWEQVGCEP